MRVSGSCFRPSWSYALWERGGVRDERSEEWEDGRMGGGRGVRSGRNGRWEGSLLDGVRQDGCV